MGEGKKNYGRKAGRRLGSRQPPGTLGRLRTKHRGLTQNMGRVMPTSVKNALNLKRLQLDERA